MKKHKGFSLMFLIVILFLVGVGLSRATEFAIFKRSQQLGGQAANDVTAIVDAWSRTMDYRCVNSDISAVNIADLNLSSVLYRRINEGFFALQIIPAPNPSLKIDFMLQDRVAQQRLIDELNLHIAALQLPPLVSVSITSGKVTITAIRGKGAIASGVYGHKGSRNANAVTDTLIMNGNSAYGLTGC